MTVGTGGFNRRVFSQLLNIIPKQIGIENVFVFKLLRVSHLIYTNFLALSRGFLYFDYAIITKIITPHHYSDTKSENVFQIVNWDVKAEMFSR